MAMSNRLATSLFYYYTSAKQDVLLPGVCLPVCLLATSRENYSADLDEHFTWAVSSDKQVTIRFWI